MATAKRLSSEEQASQARALLALLSTLDQAHRELPTLGAEFHQKLPKDADISSGDLLRQILLSFFAADIGIAHAIGPIKKESNELLDLRVLPGTWPVFVRLVDMLKEAGMLKEADPDKLYELSYHTSVAGEYEWLQAAPWFLLASLPLDWPSWWLFSLMNWTVEKRADEADSLHPGQAYTYVGATVDVFTGQEKGKQLNLLDSAMRRVNLILNEKGEKLAEMSLEPYRRDLMRKAIFAAAFVKEPQLAQAFKEKLRSWLKDRVGLTESRIQEFEKLTIAATGGGGLTTTNPDLGAWFTYLQRMLLVAAAKEAVSDDELASTDELLMELAFADEVNFVAVDWTEVAGAIDNWRLAKALVKNGYPLEKRLVEIPKGERQQVIQTLQTMPLSRTQKELSELWDNFIDEMMHRLYPSVVMRQLVARMADVNIPVHKLSGHIKEDLVLIMYDPDTLPEIKQEAGVLLKNLSASSAVTVQQPGNKLFPAQASSPAQVSKVIEEMENLGYPNSMVKRYRSEIEPLLPDFIREIEPLLSREEKSFDLIHAVMVGRLEDVVEIVNRGFNWEKLHAYVFPEPGNVIGKSVWTRIGKWEKDDPLAERQYPILQISFKGQITTQDKVDEIYDKLKHFLERKVPEKTSELMQTLTYELFDLIMRMSGIDGTYDIDFNMVMIKNPTAIKSCELVYRSHIDAASPVQASSPAEADSIIQKLRLYFSTEQETQFFPSGTKITFPSEAELYPGLISRRYQELTRLPRSTKEKPVSLHLANGNSFLPLADALAGWKVIATDISDGAMSRVITTRSELKDVLAAENGDLEFGKLEVGVDSILKRYGENSIDHLTITNLLNSPDSSMALALVIVDILEEMIKVLRPGGTITFSSDLDEAMILLKDRISDTGGITLSDPIDIGRGTFSRTFYIIRVLEKRLNPSAEATTSSPLKLQNQAINSGGIDFRSLPIVTQAMSNLSANLSKAPLAGFASVNLTQEWQAIERMVSAGITPSAERIKEYIQASCAKDDLGDIDKVILCISDILRKEEENCCVTDATLRDILVVLESVDNASELKSVFVGIIS